MPQSKQLFLTAEWRDLVMLNYEVDSSLLRRYIPFGTSLDSFEGKIYISLVGFRFCRTKLLGCFPVPFHADFEEVNLRFYVRRKNEDKNEDSGEQRRGVVFIAEIVPRRAIATTARLVYGENYKCLPMKHRIQAETCGCTTEYQWAIGPQWCTLSAQTTGLPSRPSQGSLEQFITEHYWGYSTQKSVGCLEYHVSHVPWEVWTATAAVFQGDASAVYGRELGAVLEQSPDCAFVASGSPVTVFRGVRVL
jgi:hypothetical protein